MFDHGSSKTFLKIPKMHASTDKCIFPQEIENGLMSKYPDSKPFDP
jgi:hypothetical protein